MSPSDSVQIKIPGLNAELTVETQDPSTEIFLVDARLSRVAKSVGSLSWSGAPGVYKLRLRCGRAMTDRLLRLKPSERRVLKDERVEIASPAPLEGTSTTHEYHRDPAELVSRALLAERTKAAEFEERTKAAECFIFVREYDNETDRRDNPASGLTLLSADEAIRIPIAQAAAEWNDDDRWTAFRVTLPPGSYRLRAEQAGRATEQIMVLWGGWQTQVFIGRQRGESGDASLLMDDAVVFMTRNAAGFVNDDPQLMRTEALRVGLMQGRDVVPAAKEELDSIVAASGSHPMLGIYAANIVLERKTPDVAFVNRILDKLEELKGHPDVEALRLAVNPTGPVTADFSIPPMLRHSLKRLLAASVARPELIPAASLTARVSSRLVSAGVWCAWSSIERAEETPMQEETGLEWDEDWHAAQRALLAQYLRVLPELGKGAEPGEGATRILDEVVKVLRLPASVIKEQARILAQQGGATGSMAAQLLPKSEIPVGSPTERVVEVVADTDFSQNWRASKVEKVERVKRRWRAPELAQSSQLEPTTNLEVVSDVLTRVLLLTGVASGAGLVGAALDLAQPALWLRWLMVLGVLLVLLPSMRRRLVRQLEADRQGPSEAKKEPS